MTVRVTIPHDDTVDITTTQGAEHAVKLGADDLAAVGAHVDVLEDVSDVPAVLLRECLGVGDLAFGGGLLTVSVLAYPRVNANADWLICHTGKLCT